MSMASMIHCGKRVSLPGPEGKVAVVTPSHLNRVSVTHSAHMRCDPGVSSSHYNTHSTCLSDRLRLGKSICGFLPKSWYIFILGLYFTLPAQKKNCGGREGQPFVRRKKKRAKILTEATSPLMHLGAFLRHHFCYARYPHYSRVFKPLIHYIFKMLLVPF